MSSTNHVFLIGFMGSGKTTIGRLLSTAISLPFIDLDDVIEHEQGKSVSILFNELGEARFRELEHEVLLNYAKGKPCLISTGGGVPCQFDNMEVMRQNGATIYLKASSHELALRLKDAVETRPLLKGVEYDCLPAYIESMLFTREPYYVKAEYVVETDGLTDEAVLKQCIDILSITKK